MKGSLKIGIGYARNPWICKDKCKLMTEPKLNHITDKKYKNGLARCTICEHYFELAVTGYRCPCCKCIMRTNARTTKNRKKHG